MARPRITEPRKVRQPFTIELLPMDVLEAIKRLRNLHGQGWAEIERLSSLPYDAAWESKKNFGKFGFVNWDELPTRTLEAFPKLRLPQANLYRWYTVRVEQAVKELEVRAAQAREIATVFVNSGVADDDKAVLNAARDVIFGLLESGDDKSRMNASVGLIELGKVMQKARTNDLRKEQIKQDARKIDLLEKKLDQVRKKAGALAQTLEGAAGEKPMQLTREQLLDQVKEIYGAV